MTDRQREGREPVAQHRGGYPLIDGLGQPAMLPRGYSGAPAVAQPGAVGLPIDHSQSSFMGQFMGQSMDRPDVELGREHGVRWPAEELAGPPELILLRLLLAPTHGSTG